MTLEVRVPDAEFGALGRFLATGLVSAIARIRLCA